MKAYLHVFLNYKQNNWAKLFSITEFIYNNTKNASTDHISFKLNCSYHLCVSYNKDVDLLKSKTTDKVAAKLRKLMTIYKENL